MTDFQRKFSNAPWESKVGYCRTIRAGNNVFVTGTAPISPDGSTYKPGDPYEQAVKCFELIELALAEQGCSLKNVVRTRMFVTDIRMWEEFGKAHHKFFIDHPPATTMVEVSALIDPDMLIEIEADAYV